MKPLDPFNPLDSRNFSNPISPYSPYHPAYRDDEKTSTQQPQPEAKTALDTWQGWAWLGAFTLVLIVFCNWAGPKNSRWPTR